MQNADIITYQVFSLVPETILTWISDGFSKGIPVSFMHLSTYNTYLYSNYKTIRTIYLHFVESIFSSIITIQVQLFVTYFLDMHSYIC